MGQGELLFFLPFLIPVVEEIFVVHPLILFGFAVVKVGLDKVDELLVAFGEIGKQTFHQILEGDIFCWIQGCRLGLLHHSVLDKVGVGPSSGGLGFLFLFGGKVFGVGSGPGFVQIRAVCLGAFNGFFQLPFLDGLVDRIYEFRDGGVREYLGDIWYFLEKRKVESLQEIERKDSPTTVKSIDNTNGKLSYEQKKEQEKLLRRLRKAVESVEEELANVEAEIAAYDARFATATEYNADDYAKYDALKQRYDSLMHEWEKASYELEITEQN